MGVRRPSVDAERDHAVVLVDGCRRGAEIPVEALVVLEPPEGGPRDYDPAAASIENPLDLVDRRLVVDRRAPVVAVTLGERDDAAIRRRLGSHLPVIHENQGFVGPNEIEDLRAETRELVEPGPPSPIIGVGRDPPVLAVPGKQIALAVEMPSVALELLLESLATVVGVGAVRSIRGLRLVERLDSAEQRREACKARVGARSVVEALVDQREDLVEECSRPEASTRRRPRVGLRTGA